MDKETLVDNNNSLQLLESFADLHKKLIKEIPGIELNSGISQAMNACNEQVKKICAKDLSASVTSTVNSQLIDKITSTFEYLDDLVFILTPDLEIAHISPTVVNRLGYSKKDILGNYFSDLLPIWDDSNKTMATLLSMSLYSDKVRALRKKISNKKGELTWYELRLSGIGFSKDKGNYEGFLILARNIEEQVKREDILKNDKRMAEAHSMLKSEYLANMSHEIRTPLNGIVGFSNILTHDKVDHEKRKRYVRNIESCSKQLMTLVNDIIDFSKMETGQLKLYPSRFDLHDLLEDLKTYYTSEITSSKKKVKVVLSKSSTSDKLMIHTDEVRLRQILINLLNNALKFTDTGEVEFGYTLKGNNKVSFFVRDTGGGIPVEFQPYIFDPYKRAGNSKPGNGLGLAISKGLVEQLNGNIKLNTQIGIGSEFSFVLSVSA